MKRLKKMAWWIGSMALALTLTACRGGMGNLFDLN